MRKPIKKMSQNKTSNYGTTIKKQPDRVTQIVKKLKKQPAYKRMVQRSRMSRGKR